LKRYNIAGRRIGADKPTRSLVSIVDESSAFETDDLLSPAVIADPYTYFGKLREADPVHWNPVSKTWVITRYDDVVWILRNHALFSSVIRDDPAYVHPTIDESDWELAEYAREAFDVMSLYDRPEHTQMRQTVHRWFTPKAVERWRGKLRQTALRLIREHRPDGGMDIKEELATPLPLLTMSVMLDIPLDDAPRLRDLVDVVTTGAGVGPNRYRKIAAAFTELQDYFVPLIEARLTEPGDDLISLLADGERRGVFTRNQCLANSIFMIRAGHETTLNLISNGVLAFIRNPQQWDILRGDPEQTCGPATEECLRFEPTLTATSRVATADVELRGTTVRAGDDVMAVIAAANRDPRVFDDPDRFDITRSPNPHVGFGGGIHHCLGAALARVETQEALRVLAQTFPRLRLRTDDIEYLPITARFISSLPVEWP
jgi:cytochrome P450